MIMHFVDSLVACLHLLESEVKILLKSLYCSVVFLTNLRKENCERKIEFIYVCYLLLNKC